MLADQWFLLETNCLQLPCYSNRKPRAEEVALTLQHLQRRSSLLLPWLFLSLLLLLVDQMPLRSPTTTPMVIHLQCTAKLQDRPDRLAMTKGIEFQSYKSYNAQIGPWICRSVRQKFLWPEVLPLFLSCWFASYATPDGVGYTLTLCFTNCIHSFFLTNMSSDLLIAA